MAIPSMDVSEKSFLHLFLILYIIGVQKILTLGPVNFVRVDQSLQLHVIFPTIELEIQPLWAGRVSDIVLQNYSMDWFVAYLVSGRTHALSRLSHGIRKSINS